MYLYNLMVFMELGWPVDGVWVCNLVSIAMLPLLQIGFLGSLLRDRDWQAQPSLRSILSGEREQIQGGAESE